MFNSTVLEVAAGLCFTFLAVSLATGVIVEALASMTAWRSRTLLSGVKQLVNDPEFNALAKSLYEHALISPRGPGAAAPTRNLPSYIDPDQFGNALMDVVGLSKALAGSPAAAAAEALPETLKAAVDRTVPVATNKQMNELLTGVLQRSRNEPEKIRKELAAWFDHGMDRVSGVYKRHTQVASIVVALVLCGLLNIDAYRIARTLWAQPGVAHIAGIGTTMPDAFKAIQQLQDSFPIGWASVPRAAGHFVAVGWVQIIVGWVITALATLFGAPFWFDALQSVTRLKGSGPSPDEKKDNRAAAA